MRYNPFKHACFLSILCEMYAGLSLFKHAYMYWYSLLVCWTSVKHDYICYEWSWNCNVIMVSWIGIWYGFEIGYNCHNICIHGDGIEFRGEKICMVNFITTWYATTRCTVDGSGTCQGPFFYVFPCQDCMEVMGHVTPPYICSLRRGTIVHVWALYLWRGISHVLVSLE